MGSWVGIENVSCVVMSVRVSVMCCGSVHHYYYSSSRVDFLVKLLEKLLRREWVQTLWSIGQPKNSSFIFILGSELWEQHFDSLLHLVEDYVFNIWEARKTILNYMVMTHLHLSLQPGIWRILLGSFGRMVNIMRQGGI